MAGSAYSCLADAHKAVEKALSYVSETGADEGQREGLQALADEVASARDSFANPDEAAEPAPSEEKGARTAFAGPAKELTQAVQKKKSQAPY